VFAQAWEPTFSLTPIIAVSLMMASDWRPWLADALAMLSEKEAERVRRRHNETHRDVLVLAYALHRLLLGNMLGLDPKWVPLDRDAQGCPRVAGGFVCTSLSHADDLIAVAMTASGPVGVDIEPAGRSSVMSEIAHCVCHPSECIALGALAVPARSEALLAMWVRKEAILKAAGIGLALPMETFAAAADQVVTLPMPDVPALQVRMLEVTDHGVAAVAGRPGTGIECRWLRPCDTSRVAGGTKRQARAFDCV